MTESQQTSPEPAGRHYRAASFRVLLSFAKGLGFSLGLLLVVLVVYALNVRNEAAKKASTTQQSTPRWFKRFGPDAKLRIASHEAHGAGANLVVLGTIVNDGTDSWHMVDVEAQFFDRAGKLVGLCNGNSSAVLRPGRERYFSVSCGAFRNFPVPEYATYKVEIVDAQYEAEDGT